ncbi:MAG: twitching motility protein PilT [Rickettsiales bacterium]|jgi:twitching motility protein PilT
MQSNSTLDKLIDYIIKNKASDLHISSGNNPMARIDGELGDIPEFKALNNTEVSDILFSIMSDVQKDDYLKNMELDFSMQTSSGYRFRINAFNNIHGPAAALREIPSESISLEGISAPPVLTELCKLHQGLILVVGPTGSGKSTTLAAMLNHLNYNYKHHIITVEDPVEFVYKSDTSLINQREVGSSTKSFPDALKSAMREDPDVLMVGELRDLKTIKLALTAAETGHLVMATLHTNSAAQSINRIIDVFPSSDKDLARSMVSSSLAAVVSQRLAKKKGGGRVAVYEIMVANNSIRNLIRENKIPQINSMIEMGKKQGMTTAKDSLLSLLNKGLIDQKVAEGLLKSMTGS